MTDDERVEVKRAAMLMRVAKSYIEKYTSASGFVFYDEADCDGWCLAEDLRISAEALDGVALV